MAEQTVNEAEVLDTGADEPVAPDGVNQDEAEAAPVEESNEQGEQSDAEDVEAATGETETKGLNYDEFLKAKHVDPSDPEALKKVTEMYFNAERKMYEDSQKRAQLERQVNQPTQLNPSDTIALAEVRAMRNEQMARDFKERTGLSKADEMKMVEYLEQPVVLPNGGQARRAELVNAGLLSLDEVYKIAVGVAEPAAAAKENLRKQVVKDIATSRNAARPKAAATNGQQFSKPQGDEDPFVQGLKEFL